MLRSACNVFWGIIFVILLTFFSFDFSLIISILLEFEVTYNSEGILVFRFNGYDYTGGVHGTPMQVGRVYNLSIGKELTLCELLGNDENTVLKLV